MNNEHLRTNTNTNTIPLSHGDIQAVLRNNQYRIYYLLSRKKK